jgi:hypothetical protein
MKTWRKGPHFRDQCAPSYVDQVNLDVINTHRGGAWGLRVHFQQPTQATLVEKQA